MTTAKYMTILIGTAAAIAAFPLTKIEGQDERHADTEIDRTVDRSESAVGRSGDETRRMRISFYCACGICCDGYAAVKVESGQRRTASGYRLKPDGSDAMRIAAAGPGIRFGTKIEIPNLGTVVVRDRGGAIQGNRLDVYTGHDPGAHQRARELGIQYHTVKITQGE
jgi:3D (Asp-Asp-Asp) domain-containing protein